MVAKAKAKKAGQDNHGHQVGNNQQHLHGMEVSSLARQKKKTLEKEAGQDNHGHQVRNHQQHHLHGMEGSSLAKPKVRAKMEENANMEKEEMTVKVRCRCNVTLQDIVAGAVNGATRGKIV